MTQIEKMRKAKTQTRWLPWIWLAGAGIWFSTLLINIYSGKMGFAVISACCFLLSTLNYYATSQIRLHKELVAEIDRLKKTIEK